MILNIYYSRADIENRIPSAQINALKTSEKLPYFKLNEYSGSGLKMFGFENGLVGDSEHVTVLTNMLIPRYFENTIGQDVHGLFLAQIGLPQMAHDFVDDLLSLGRFGCPKRIVIDTNSSKDHFKFNRMRFYPFIMPDFTVGFYICDEGTPELHWPPYTPTERGVALDYPVTYEPTLGLYMTRSSHIEN